MNGKDGLIKKRFLVGTAIFSIAIMLLGILILADRNFDNLLVDGISSIKHKTPDIVSDGFPAIHHWMTKLFLIARMMVFFSILLCAAVFFFMRDDISFGLMRKIPPLGLSPERSFLIIALFFGVAVTFITPPFQAPDEETHFYRAFEVSELKFVSGRQGNQSGSMLPVSLRGTVDLLMADIPFHCDKKFDLKKLNSALAVKLAPDNLSFIANRAVFCTAIPYIPQAIGMAVSRVLGSSPIIMLYAGRLFNLAAWILLIFMAIKLTPIAKWLFFLLAIMPMSIFQSASLSSDVVTIGLAFLVVAAYLRYSLAQNSNFIGQKEIVLLILLGICLSLAKSGYIFLAFILLFIPAKNFKHRYGHFVFSITFLLSIIAINAAWFFVSRQLYNAPEVNVSAGSQIHYMISNPLGYGMIFIRSIFENLPDYLYTFVGGKLGWNDTLLSPFIISCYYPALFMAVVFEPLRKQRLNNGQVFLCISIFVSTIVFMMTFFYISYNVVGAKIIGCTHGRYFIPIAPLFFLPWYGRSNFLFEHKPDWQAITQRFAAIMSVYSVFFLSYALYAIVMRYYF